MKKHEIKERWLETLCDREEINPVDLKNDYKAFTERFEKAKKHGKK